MSAPPPYDDLSKAGPYPPQQGAYPPPQQGAYPPPQQGAYPPPQQGAYPPPAPGAYPPPGAYQAAYTPQTTQPGTVVVQQVAQPRPPDNLILSVIACVCCNAFCLGLIALVFAYQSQQSANGNRMEEARSKGDTAKKLAIAAIIVTIVVVVIGIILRVAVFSAYYGSGYYNNYG